MDTKLAQYPSLDSEARTAQRFCTLAQGCRAAATLGKHKRKDQPRRGCAEAAWRRAVRHTAFGVDGILDVSPRVAAAPQPWAILQNRFAVRSGGMLAIKEGAEISCGVAQDTISRSSGASEEVIGAPA